MIWETLTSVFGIILLWVAIGGLFLGILKWLWPSIKRRFNIITPNEVYDGLVELYSELQDIKQHLGMPTSEEMEAMQTLEQAGWDLSHRAKVRVVVEEEE
jgi:hypothetical protein